MRLRALADVTQQYDLGKMAGLAKMPVKLPVSGFIKLRMHTLKNVYVNK